MGAARLSKDLMSGSVGDTDLLSGGTIQDMILSEQMVARLHELHVRYVGGQLNGRRCVLIRCDMADLNLRGVNFKNADLINCNFSGADLTEADLSGANACNGDFTNAKLRSANLQRADVRGSVFDGADLTDCSLSGADLRQGVCGADIDAVVGRENPTQLRGGNA